MIGVEKVQDFREVSYSQAEKVKDIKPIGNITPADAQAFWNSELSKTENKENKIQDIKELVNQYFSDIVSNSEFPETLSNKPFDVLDIEPRNAEKNQEYREQFDDIKKELKKQWEIVNNKEWPKYDHDVYSAGEKLIRRKGDDYDAHHVLPLCLGV